MPGFAICLDCIYTSPFYLLRCAQHRILPAPSHVVVGGQAGSRVVAAFTQAQASAPPLAWDGDPGGWGDPHEDRLITALRAIGAQQSGGLPATLEAIIGWPAWAA